VHELKTFLCKTGGIMCRNSIIPYLLVLTFVCLTGLSNAQPQSLWIRNIDAEADECFWDVYAVHDGSYIAVGASGNQWWNGGIWLMSKVNANGEIIWSNTFGNYQDGAAARTVIEADNGDFCAAGLNRQNGNVEVMRIDSEGEQIWRNQYLAGEAKAIIELKSGEFLVCGVSNMQGFLLLIDDEGREVWNRVYPIGQDMGSYGYFTSMRETENQVVVSGEGRRAVNELWHIWLVKIDLESEGNVEWERHHTVGRISTCNTIISCEGGFVFSGMANGTNTYLMKANREGEDLWQHIYNVETSIEIGHCLAKLGDGGFAIAGRAQNARDVNLMPLMIRTNEEGTELGRSYFDFSEVEGLQVGRNTFYSIVLGADNSLVAAGVVNTNETAHDGLILKWEVEQAGPYFILWTPEDTLLSVLPGDSIQFTVHANHQWVDRFDIYWWLAGGDTISNDTTVTIVFEELGDYSVNCGINDGVRSALKTWHINAVEFYILSFQPDSLDITIRRGREVDFALAVRSVEGVELDYTWTHVGRDHRQEDIGEEAEVSYHFDLTGEHRIIAVVTAGGNDDEVAWNIDVRSSIWSWWPHELELTVPMDTTIDFAMFPFNPDSDSLKYLWEMDGDSLDSYRVVEVDFPEDGLHEVTGYAWDGAEVDTIHWTVNVIYPDRIGYSDGALLPDQVILYPAVPNPFNEVTTVKYRLPHGMDIDFAIFDLIGRRVMTLERGFHESGYHTSRIGGENLPAGVYFLRLSANGMSLMQKAVLIK